jgi:short-subunit dehydrogenase
LDPSFCFFFKAFVDKFSRDLSAEVKDSCVTVQTVHPGFVVTNMSKLRRSTWTAPTPDTFAKAALSNLGLDDRTAGFWFHKIQVQNRMTADIFQQPLNFYFIILFVSTALLG